MDYSLAVKNVTVTAPDRELLEKKMQRLAKHLVPPFHARVVLQHDQHHRKGSVITCRVTVTQTGGLVHAQRSAGTIQEALDMCLSALQTELKKRRDKRRRRR